MLPLVSLSETELADISDRIPGGAANIQDIYPLAPLQEGVVFHHSLSDEVDPYVTPALFRIGDEQTLNSFCESLQFIIDRHDVLRTAILWRQREKPLQVVLREARLPVTWLPVQQGDDVLAKMQGLCAPEVQWMELEKAPLMQLTVAAEADGGYLVLLQHHHVVIDHVGLEVVQQE
ncbi:condensation domain-containing protein, partial [Pseudoalteromonas sp. MMG007]|uniref:condensation domain-containing protein n=1 Tax=Pseudoalteromonas sp. MMG007 TaxID=2822684 RepID=UPI001B37DACA